MAFNSRSKYEILAGVVHPSWTPKNFVNSRCCFQGVNNWWNRWSENQSINRWQSMPINRLISIIDEQSMLRFFVIIDFIDYHYCYRLFPIKQLMNEFKSQTFVCTGKCGYTYLLERVGLSIGHRLADANRCQLTDKASIVIDWSIDFPIIGFIDCSSPVFCRGRQRCVQSYNARAQLLFCSLNILFGSVLIAIVVVVCLSSPLHLLAEW